MAKKRQLHKVKEVLPSTPGKKAEIVASLGRSPRTRKLLSEKGMLCTPEEEKEVLALKAMAEDLKEGIGQVKKDNSRTGRAAFGATKSLTSGRNVKEGRAQKTLEKTLALDRRSVKAGINKREQILKGEEINWLTTKRQVRKDASSEDVKTFLISGHFEPVVQLEVRKTSVENVWVKKYGLNMQNTSWKRPRGLP